MSAVTDKRGRLISRIDQSLGMECGPLCETANATRMISGLSVVLFLLTMTSPPGGNTEEPCLILNKRSAAVKQPGDLCCPGGRVSLWRDRWLSRLLTLPCTPLTRWRHWREWRHDAPGRAALLRLYLATGLREAFEEMRLNPLAMSFLGPLPEQPLVMFDRVIYPLVGWVDGRKRFVPNHEVEKIVYIPVSQLLQAGNYCQYRIRIVRQEGSGNHKMDFPGYRHRDASATELLWGATYRIAMDFLKIVFDFSPPPEEQRPVIRGTMHKDYLSGANNNRA